MSAITLDATADDRIRFEAGGVVLAEYVFRPTEDRFESPRPYLSPLRTRGGELVSLFRPHDHVWHKGIAWSLPVVGDENFWGGPTFVRGEGYVQLPNNGTQQHRSFETIDRATDADGSIGFRERLEWITEGGRLFLEEERTVTVRLGADDSWVLDISTRLLNRSGTPIAFGSPTTRGRDNAGYGGLFWRGPRSFTGGTILAPGVAGGDELRGIRSPWMGFTGVHDGSGRSSTIVMVDDPSNGAEPTEWFARSTEFACLCPAPFFSAERTLEADAALELHYSVVIADGAADPDRAERLAAEAR